MIDTFKLFIYDLPLSSRRRCLDVDRRCGRGAAGFKLKINEIVSCFLLNSSSSTLPPPLLLLLLLSFYHQVVYFFSFNLLEKEYPDGG